MICAICEKACQKISILYIFVVTWAFLYYFTFVVEQIDFFTDRLFVDFISDRYILRRQSIISSIIHGELKPEFIQVVNLQHYNILQLRILTNEYLYC